MSEKDAIKQRHSVRNYKPERIEEKTIDLLRKR